MPVALHLKERMLKWSSHNRRDANMVLWLGDSILRDTFTMAVCLLDAIGAIEKRPNYQNNPHQGSGGQFIYARMRAASGVPGAGPTLGFFWAHRVCARWTPGMQCKEPRGEAELQSTNFTHNAILSLPRIYGGEEAYIPVRGVNRTNWFHQIAKESMLVLYGGLAFTQTEHEARANVEMTVTWLRHRLRPSAVIAIMETMPAHFPRTAFGEYDKNFHAHLPESERRCRPHDEALGAARPRDNFRRAVANAYAELHALPLLRTWEDSSAHHEDHSINSSELVGYDKRLGSFDCRHCEYHPTHATACFARD